ncbi:MULTISPECIES: PTS sugar transporter subunit IIA [Paenibacillus]|jgi:PTS system mannitol-specific IIA component|uniref:Mannitol-specific phosphotransferase enzyme IIA component n=4 Tax=Paenibacillus TaxID=44249 RepID=A0A0N0UIL6_9BACL|nr:MULTISPECIES: PTS sugar transporter subunit IIA [Paenibacillus]OPG94500.1 PTS mannitol transporter subunit IIA [Chryseobacterium mucoviscidosis]KGP79002.1 PTS mannitol transporter subunit IIA [Paenibacillus sp. MAEPY2]KGP88251.1 PTS mannitol transporter subunit IIA [Paenibacillus sp. MAEPY1]KOY18254.1 PTS mannitol transporter subunit IIA [Paenibacillus xylanivorans]MCZ1265116.1 PTS mannitol transporter subunit IIA [Paenibacillus tundrae]
MSVLTKDKVIMNATAQDKYEAIRMAGQILKDAGHITAEYIDKMLEREEIVSTYVGNGLAIPHGTKESKSFILSTGISVIQFPQGVDFGEEKAYMVIGIAAQGGEHMEILTSIAVICAEEENMEALRHAQTAEEVITILESEMEL